jgi:hypothetical protein
MKNILYWIAAGGLSFWLPVIMIYAIFWDRTNTVALNVGSVLGLVILGLACKVYKKKMPRWGWVLAGIYILGPSAILTTGAFTKIQSSPAIHGGNYILLILCLFPPTTLWFSLLDGTLFSVVAATVGLPLLAIYQRNERLESQ